MNPEEENFVDEVIQQQQMEAEMEAAYAEQQKKDKAVKLDFKKKLKGQINIIGLFKWLSEMHDSWTPISVVEMQLTDEKVTAYPFDQCARIIGTEDDNLYHKCIREGIAKDISYYYVWQIHIEDDYSGYLLFELKDGKYFKVSYGC